MNLMDAAANIKTEDIKTAVNTGKVVAKFVSNTSITRLAKDSIFQFPVIISSSIDNDEIFVMAKALERNYASMLLSVISMSSYIDLSKYGKDNYLVKYLKKFHSNSDIGGEILPAGESTAIESANIIDDDKIFAVDMPSLCDSVYEACDMTSINDIYRPFKRTTRILEDALEAKGTTGKTITIGNTKLENADAIAKLNEEKYVENGKAIRRGTEKGGAGVINSSYMTDMTPTMINISFVADATGKGDTWTQNVTIGVKSMVRMAKSGVVINNMVDAFKDRALFTWIKWTNGEINAAELLFGVSKALQDGYAAGKKDNWMKRLKGRKHMQGVNKLIGRQLLPNASVIITESEALAIQQDCGVDPHNPTDAAKMMNKYFMLAFGIYDTESKLLDIIYDGESQFSSYSIRELVAKNKKDTNLLASTY